MANPSSNDEVERRRAAPASNEGTLSQSSIPPLPGRRRDRRSLELLLGLFVFKLRSAPAKVHVIELANEVIA